jgi:hypothetical protein
MRYLIRFLGGIWDTTRQVFWAVADPGRNDQIQEGSTAERVLRALRSNQESVQSTSGLLRLVLAVSALVVFEMIGGHLFESVEAQAIAQRVRETNFFFRNVNIDILTPIVWVINPHNLRYTIPPLAAIVFILVSAGTFVQDIYNLPGRKDGWNYVIASMFGLDYPMLTINRGQAALPEKGINLVNTIGGPGYIVIQPGNLVVLRTLHEYSSAEVTTSYFLAPFERIAMIANLDEQHGFVDEISTLTRDGIYITLRDIHFRFQILPGEQNGKIRRRSLQDPYPYSHRAILDMLNNLPVTDEGLDPWRTAVKRSVLVQISEYVNSHDLDYLTAPRENAQDPRARMHEELLLNNIGRRNLQKFGAELLWVDIGHLDIVESGVDNQRIDLWAATVYGRAELIRAEGEAKRKTLKELGRADAQARMINSLSHVLADVDFNSDDQARLRNIVLVRIAQMLDTLGEPRNPELDGG